MIDTPVAGVAALTEKVRLYLERAHCRLIHQDIDKPDTLSELLSDASYDGAWAIVRIYQDLLRITGQRPDLSEVQLFDSAGWLDAFNALRGHEMSRRGPRYMEPEAFPDGDVRKAPPGQTLWRALAPWQQNEVRAQAACREGREAIIGRDAVRDAWTAAKAAADDRG